MTSLFTRFNTLNRRIKLHIKLAIAFLFFALVPWLFLSYLVSTNIRAILIEQNTGTTLEETITRVNFSLGFFFAVTAIIATALAIFISRWFSDPFVALVDSSSQAAGGAWGLSMPIAAQHEARELAENINILTSRLQEINSTTEQRIAERTHALEGVVRSLQISSRIGNQLVTILDLDELLIYSVNHIQTEFNYYHSQIYLLDDEAQYLVLAYGSGQIGQQMKEQNFRLGVQEGIAGRVARTNEYVLSNDVSKTAYFSHHPLLSETNSELALPLRKGGKLFGVLDIQARRLNRFVPTDIPLLQSLANQIAIAIDNARLVAEAQTALNEVERLNRRLTQEAWEKLGETVATTGYRYSRGGSEALAPGTGILLAPMKQAAVKKQLVRQRNAGNGGPAASELAVPLVLRGEVIGVLGVKREETPDWADEEVSAVEAVADQITRALENARLSKEQEKTIEQLQEIDRLKSEFLTSMSHELRTPLNSIIGFADVIIQGIDGEVSDMALSDVRLIHNSGQHLLALINDILDISKIEAGMMELVPEALDMRSVIRDVISSSSSLFKDKPVKIVVEADRAKRLIHADKLRINQILLNLVSNSAKFTHEGSITIKARIDEEQPDFMLVSVIDTGIGIPANKQEAIFDRFQQADSSTTRQYGGTGLGLAICRQLVEMHGGQLEVKSEIGVGSEFYFTIPLDPKGGIAE